MNRLPTALGDADELGLNDADGESEDDGESERDALAETDELGETEGETDDELPAVRSPPCQSSTASLCAAPDADVHIPALPVAMLEFVIGPITVVPFFLTVIDDPLASI